MNEIIFNVRQDELAGGYIASAARYGIHTQGETIEELRRCAREAVDCYFDETMDAPKAIRLRGIHDELLTR
jgi:predicted RNase H-like HicB family nuclease